MPAMSFDRQPGETTKAYTSFVEYLRLGPQRSVEKTAESMGRGWQTCRKWCERHAWVSRAADYDAHLVSVERVTEEVATKARAIERLRSRESFKDLEHECARRALEHLRDWLQGEIAIKGIRDAAYMLDIASKVGRLSLGLATEHQEVTGEGGGAVKIDISAALDKVYGPIIDVKSGPAIAGHIGNGASGGMPEGTDGQSDRAGSVPADEADGGELGGESV
jgi:hypothetical protein